MSDSAFAGTIVVLGIILLIFSIPSGRPKKIISKEDPQEPLRPLSNKDIKYGAPKRMHRTFKDGESLTDDEIQFIQGRLQMKLPPCPDCESGELYTGPTGGGSINVKCGNKDCGSKFNFMMPLGIDRLSDASPDKPLKMVSFGPNR